MNFNPTRRNFECSFLNQPQEREKECNASITYGNNCEQELGVFAGMGIGDSVATTELSLDNIMTADVSEYCFSVTATSGMNTVVVEGMLDIINLGT